MKKLARHKSPSTIKCADFNHTLGLTMTHDLVKNAKNDEYQ
jgi:hypothetical protein